MLGSDLCVKYTLVLQGVMGCPECKHKLQVRISADDVSSRLMLIRFYFEHCQKLFKTSVRMKLLHVFWCHNLANSQLLFSSCIYSFFIPTKITKCWEYIREL